MRYCPALSNKRWCYGTGCCCCVTHLAGASRSFDVLRASTVILLSCVPFLPLIEIWSDWLRVRVRVALIGLVRVRLTAVLLVSYTVRVVFFRTSGKLPSYPQPLIEPTSQQYPMYEHTRITIMVVQRQKHVRLHFILVLLYYCSMHAACTFRQRTGVYGLRSERP